MEEILRPPTGAAAIFAALDPAEYPFEDAAYSPAEAKSVVAAYAAAKGLDRGAPSKAHVVLDPHLCDALFKGVLKKGDAYPTHCLRSDVANAWLARWRRETRVSRGARATVKKGALPPIKVESDRRGGDRRVTRVWGYETYHVDPEELRETLGVKLATACAIGEVEGAKNAKLREVIASGERVEKVKILTEHSAFPRSSSPPRISSRVREKSVTADERRGWEEGGKRVGRRRHARIANREGLFRQAPRQRGV